VSTLTASWAAADALQLVVWIHAVAVLLAAAEYLWVREDFGERGAMSWKVFRASGSGAYRGLVPDTVQRRLFGRRGMTAMLWAQIAAVMIFVIAPPRSWAQWTALAVSTLILLLITARQRYGQDGADQMNVIVGITCVVAYGPFHSEVVMLAGLWFLALQAVLAYLSAGIAKVISPVWRRGLAVGMVVDTASYGSRAAGELLRRHAWIGRALTWGTVAFELTFVGALVAPLPVTVTILAAGVLFHLGIAVVMGLNNFVPAFLSTYPAVLFVSAQHPSIDILDLSLVYR
jgi:hypothetical protein